MYEILDQSYKKIYNSSMKKIISIVLGLIFIPVIVFGQINNPRANPKSFTFVVLGDRTAGANQPIFEQILTTIKSLNSDFVINVGDLIEGYSQSESIVNSEWNSIITNLADLKNKFYFTPGNHDISDSLSERLYLSRTGYQRPYYSFSIGKNHFIVLDNSRQEKVDKPDSIQLIWLISELSKHKKSDNIFCFMHRSFWKDAYSTNKPDTFHKLFAKYGVDYVFSGHDHFYCQLVWDGITYTQVGPSGSRYKEFKKEEFGAFQNFVVVSVKDNKVKIKVMRPDGTELASNIVTFWDIKELQEIEQAVEISQMAITTISTSFGGPDEETTVYLDTIVVTIDNLLDFQLNTIGKWDLNSGHWRITPLECMIYIAPKNSGSYKFHSKIESESIYPLPRFTISYPYSKGTKHFMVSKMLTPITRLEATCNKTQKAIKVDGKLNEKIWQKVKSLAVFGSGDGGVSQTDPWEVLFAYDNLNLYIAAKMTDYEPYKISTNIKQRDEKVYNDDHLNIVLTPDIKSNVYYQFFINPEGIVLDRICKMEGKDSKKDAKWNSNIIAQGEITTGEKFTGWTLEISIPFSDLGVLDPEIGNPELVSGQGSGQDWGFNLVHFQLSKNKVSIYSVPFEHNPNTFASLKFE